MPKAKKARSKSKKKVEPENKAVLAFSDERSPTLIQEQRVHSLGQGRVCGTGSRGHKRPRGSSPLEIVVDASEGFVPLWAAGTTLRWRFNEPSMQIFFDPEAAKAELRNQFSEALIAWGAAAPVKFKENEDLWDFEIVMSSGDNCTPSGCTLARAFFPDSGRHDLMLFPKMFEQSRKEQVDTWIHEIGHIFGLRHFFATVEETAWPAEVFGTHSKFSIMNYGALSELTEVDKADLTRLYQQAWAGVLTHVNGTEIQFVQPYHVSASAPTCSANTGQGVSGLRSRGSYYGTGHLCSILP
ncbi:MAG: matrixin family metalloprotease [Acidobacteriota bacterium]